VDAQNHIMGDTYDAAGNLISIPGVASYTYDAENHLVSAGGLSYSYDGDGRRASKSSGHDYFYDGKDQPLLENDPNANWIYRYYYFDGKLVLAREGSESPDSGWVDQFWFDAIGNTRGTYTYESWATGVNGDVDYYPFGGERAYTDHGDFSNKFTGKERDPESNLDYFGARFYSSQIARFLSPDWSDDPDPVPYASLGNPQSLNLYGYAYNNPLLAPDPDGHCPSNTICVETDLHVIDAEDYLVDVYRFEQTLEQGFSQVINPVLDFLTAPRSPGCVAAATGAGALVGAGRGVLVGAFAGVGVADEVTVPAAAVVGSVGGAAAGNIVGFINCRTGSGGGGSGGSGGGSGLSGRARSKLGNLADRAAEKVRDVIRSRGGSGANVNQAGPWADRTLGETAEAAARGDSSAETAIKIAKQAGRLGQKY
jgi:RHS repeat-associated protein